jgi:Flp pilus assembly protein TadB
MADEVRPLSDEERAELEALRAEKAAREKREQAARERAELEALRSESVKQSQPAKPRREASATAAARAAAEEDRRIREQRERGAKLMEPDDDLRMPLGQKLVLGVIALLVVIILFMSKFIG